MTGCLWKCWKESGSKHIVHKLMESLHAIYQKKGISKIPKEIPHFSNLIGTYFKRKKAVLAD